MIYITGDTHGDFRRFDDGCFTEQKNLTKQDYVIICGDFGIWEDTPKEERMFDELDRKPFTTLFITGNHSNYDLLKTYKVEQFCGGKAQFIRPSIVHLMRGQIFHIEDRRFFTMGGASCHDMPGGALSMDDPLFLKKKTELSEKWIKFRIEHVSWWKEELPSHEEYEEAWRNLEAADYTVDHIITHCPPECIRLLLEVLGANGYPKDSLTDFLEQVKNKVQYKNWFFGHYHGDATTIDDHYMCYQEIVPLTRYDKG